MEEDAAQPAEPYLDSRGRLPANAHADAEDRWRAPDAPLSACRASWRGVTASGRRAYAASKGSVRCKAHLLRQPHAQMNGGWSRRAMAGRRRMYYLGKKGTRRPLLKWVHLQTTRWALRETTSSSTFAFISSRRPIHSAQAAAVQHNLELAQYTYCIATALCAAGDVVLSAPRRAHFVWIRTVRFIRLLYIGYTIAFFAKFNIQVSTFNGIHSYSIRYFIYKAA